VFSLSKRHQNTICNLLFWVFMLVGSVVTLAVLLLALSIYLDPPQKGDLGVFLVTGATALFAGFTLISGAIAQRFARETQAVTLAITSADFTLQLENQFNSDGSLLMRHGAVKFLAEKRGVFIDCPEDITPYVTDRSILWYGLNSELIDIFNYFDWIGYLTSEEGNTIDREVL
jgi:hypothetical protein